VTDGDNGLRGLTRPAPFGISLDDAGLVLLFSPGDQAVAIWLMAVFVASPSASRCANARSGAAHERARARRLADTLDHVRLLRVLGRGVGTPVRVLQQVIHPRRSRSLRRRKACSRSSPGVPPHSPPIVGAVIVMILKNYVSGFIERWNMLLGFVFVVIVIFMPEGVVPGARRLFGQG